MAKRKKNRFSKLIFSITSYVFVSFIGFVVGIYFLPFITSEEKPSKTSIDAILKNVVYEAVFVKNLKGSTFFHWGEGQLSISKKKILFEGKLSPGPDYKLYLTQRFVSDKNGFLKEKKFAVKVDNINSFNGFIITLPEGLNIEKYNSVVIWCEVFSTFITSAKYKY